MYIRAEIVTDTSDLFSCARVFAGLIIWSKSPGGAGGTPTLESYQPGALARTSVTNKLLRASSLTESISSSPFVYTDHTTCIWQHIFKVNRDRDK